MARHRIRTIEDILAIPAHDRPVALFWLADWMRYRTTIGPGEYFEWDDLRDLPLRPISEIAGLED
jgi:hypothetical protein